MAEKKSFVLRIEEDLYRALEKWAGDDFRSVNGQIEWLIYQELRKLGRIREKKDEGKKKG
jgi:hypothetical protein